ncbi:MAG: hypothetical protein OXG35_22400 [Acidobacteria bacterium]|nr:hypothetical protein [Acidobacteriota bacterium]
MLSRRIKTFGVDRRSFVVAVVGAFLWYVLDDLFAGLVGFGLFYGLALAVDIVRDGTAPAPVGPFLRFLDTFVLSPRSVRAQVVQTPHGEVVDVGGLEVEAYSLSSTGGPRGEAEPRSVESVDQLGRFLDRLTPDREVFWVRQGAACHAFVVGPEGFTWAGLPLPSGMPAGFGASVKVDRLGPRAALGVFCAFADGRALDGLAGPLPAVPVPAVPAGVEARAPSVRITAAPRGASVGGTLYGLWSCTAPPREISPGSSAELFAMLPPSAVVVATWRPWASVRAGLRLRAVVRHWYASRWSFTQSLLESMAEEGGRLQRDYDDLEAARRELGEGSHAYGDFTLSVAVPGAPAEFGALDAQVRAAFESVGAGVVRESDRPVTAWHGRLCGRPYRAGVRRLFVSSAVAACLTPPFDAGAAG